MAKWYKNVKKVRYSKTKLNEETRELTGDKRFLTLFDMAEAKREEARINARIKRGETPKGTHQYLSVCTCGCSGCIVGGTYTNTKE